MRNANKPDNQSMKAHRPCEVGVLPPQDTVTYGGCNSCCARPEKVWVIWLGSYQARLCEECLTALEQGIKQRRKEMRNAKTCR